MAKKTNREDFLKEELIKELTEIVKLMRSENNLDKKLYYYSAAYGITQRTFKYTFSKEILLMDTVFTTSWTLLIDRLNHIKSNDQNVAPDVLTKAIIYITDQLDELVIRLDTDKNYIENLENILTAAYSTTGNGNYLLERGILKY
jgi:hypothetical protein